jgi:hypothetical protein
VGETPIFSKIVLCFRNCFGRFMKPSAYVALCASWRNTANSLEQAGRRLEANCLRVCAAQLENVTDALRDADSLEKRSEEPQAVAAKQG